MSYALDAGRNSHALDALAERWLGHAVISYGELIGSGKNKLTFDQVAIDKATAYSAEGADVILRLWRVLKPRLVAERMTTVYETLERPLVSRAGADGAARHLDRPPGAVAAVGRFRPDRGACRGRASGDRRRADQCRQPQTDRRHPLRQDGNTRRHQDQDRRVVDLGADPRRTRRTGPRISEEDSGMAAGVETEIDLYRRAAGTMSIRRPIASTPPTRWRRPPPGGCRRTSRTCRTFRFAPRTAARSAAPSSPRPATSWCRRTIRRSSCGCWPRSPTFPC